MNRITQDYSNLKFFSVLNAILPHRVEVPWNEPYNGPLLIENHHPMKRNVHEFLLSYHHCRREIGATIFWVILGYWKLEQVNFLPILQEFCFLNNREWFWLFHSFVEKL
ncbi:108aa long hypothetical protein [Pyrococcus horikoshii OT3]|uniref:Uncharacterized protein n=1 Tax=Pyrococcus horikoshii (strain ATCC 700860 / DSM 12428 / JCM 9974 / NBRC 100139 / OT-3) TaxID=70601 RepID=O58702_PYRHO|nr:108aa long hypothetical protein [Pyrococcus horikoshii OT3]